jgi:glucose dehydrogenase
MAGVAVGQTVYWGCYQGYLYALEGQTGRPCWRFQAGAPVADRGPPCVHDGWVFVGARDGYLHGLDTQTGALRWKYFVVDAEARQAEAEERARRRTAPAPGTEDWDDQERREWEAYEAARKAVLAEAMRKAGLEGEAETPDEELGVPSGLDLLPWEAGGKLFLLTSQGFLHCFALPRTGPEQEVSP